MPQTRFVLQKALQLGLVPLVVINKVDRPGARPHEVLDEVFDLFVELGASDQQLDFRGVYASGRDGWAIEELDAAGRPAAAAREDRAPRARAAAPEGPLQMLDRRDGPQRLRRAHRHRPHRARHAAQPSNRCVMIKRDGSAGQDAGGAGLHLREPRPPGRRSRAVRGYLRGGRGSRDVDIGDTMAAPECPEPLPLIAVDEPTLSLSFMVNDSPATGPRAASAPAASCASGCTASWSATSPCAWRTPRSADTFKVSGRGILHLSILMETMRREGYEFMVGQPQVIYRTIDGRKAEPVEELTVDVPSSLRGRSSSTPASARRR
jgi:GTP-binding protein